MAPLKHLVVLSSILVALFLPAMEARHAAPKPSSKLVERVCNDKYINNRRFCLKALSGPKAAAAKSFETLAYVVLEAAANNGKDTRAVITDLIAKPISPAWLPALNQCTKSYDYAIRSFGLVAEELQEDPMTANYDVGVTRDEVVVCEDALKAGNVAAPRVAIGNKFLEYYISIGSVVTDILQNQSK